MVVFVHWGAELFDWPQPAQRRAADWLVKQGADLIVGHHPHVVQQPECVSGRPVFFSLGNHLFDQKYPLAKRGLIADCRISGRLLTCGAIATRTPPGSSIPRLAGPDREAGEKLEECSCELPSTLSAGGYSLRPWRSESEKGLSLEAVKDGKTAWRTAPSHLLGIQAARLAPEFLEPLLLTLEKHHSSIDGEIAPRPYVYRLSPRGPVALWRGSALAWPLLDAVLLPPAEPCLCALHRGDSFLLPSPDSPGLRTAIYRWNGFGFSGLQDPPLERLCREYFGLPRE